MDAVGIVNGSRKSQRIKLAATTANTNASTHSRVADFFVFGLLMITLMFRKIENHP
jgi:peroxiredoxin family protein